MKIEDSIIQENVPDILLQCFRHGSQFEFLGTFEPADWLTLLRQARWYSLGPLLYQRLIRERQGLVPPEYDQLLRQDYYQTVKNNMRAYHLLGQVLQRSQEAGIQVLLLKGAYLAEQVYRDIGLRPMDDLDLLVPVEEFQRGLALLNSMGFTSERSYFDDADSALRYHAPALIKDGVVIELHWDLVLRSSSVLIDIKGLWERARPITMENGQAWALGPEDLLLYLCVHTAYGHEFIAQLRSLVDIVEVLRHFADVLDWESLIDTARQWGAGRGVFLTLTLIEDLMGVAFPKERLAAMKPADWNPQALGWAKQRLFRKEPKLSPSFLRLMDEDLPPRRRFQALLQGVFPPRPVMTLIYGFPPGSWQITTRYLPHAVGRIRLYWGQFLRGLRGNALQKQEVQSTLALREWLGIKD